MEGSSICYIVVAGQAGGCMQLTEAQLSRQFNIVPGILNVGEKMAGRAMYKIKQVPILAIVERTIIGVELCCKTSKPGASSTVLLVKKEPGTVARNMGSQL
ncbi:hypothetical protein BSKO_00309 [Bryopsis sp. KO-2023]|nr:hypothetical protein BSKO_00309 [Bryopsis sp. KO-2023]